MGKVAGTSIRIGPIDYAVIYVDELTVGEEKDGELVAGWLAFEECAIKLEASLAPQQARVTLWHEILHAILVQAGHQEEHDETVLDALAYGIMQVLRDGPELAGVVGQVIP